MKRLGLTLVAALCLAASTFAAGNQPTTAKWEGNINVNKLAVKLCSERRSSKHLRLFLRTDVKSHYSQER